MRGEVDAPESHERSSEGHPREHALPRGAEKRVQNHDDDAERAQDDFWRETMKVRNLVGGNLHQGRSRFAAIGVSDACPLLGGNTAARADSGLTAEGRATSCIRLNGLSTLSDAAAMRLVNSGEATPMNTITSAIVTRMIRSRVDASGSVRFFSTVTSPSATRW